MVHAPPRAKSFARHRAPSPLLPSGPGTSHNQWTVYGLVNRGLAEFISSRYGAKAWQDIRARVEGIPQVFVAMEAYPDSLTYDLVGATCEALSVEAGPLLENFGEYWILYTAEQGYSGLLDASGADLVSFLGNLDNLHARVAVSYTELRPPSFELEEIREGVVDLHYHSERPGLTPMMVGLVRGLAKRFGEEVEVEVVRSRSSGAEHDVFRVSWT